MDIKISETETFWVFDQPPKWVAPDAEEAQLQLKLNELYKKVKNNLFLIFIKYF